MVKRTFTALLRLIQKNMSLKEDKNKQQKQRIDEQKEKIRLFWKYKGTLKEQYGVIYNALQLQYNKRKAYRNKWMDVINTYHTFKQLTLIYTSFIKRKEYLKELKKEKFIIWKHSKETERTIAKYKNMKNLKIVYMTMNLNFNYKKNYINEKRDRVIGRLLVSFFVKSQLNYRIKRFAIRNSLFNCRNSASDLKIIILVMLVGCAQHP